MSREIFYTLGEDKKIDKLFKKCRKKFVLQQELLEKYKESVINSDELFTEIRLAVEKLKKIKLPPQICHINSEGTITSVEY